MNARIIDLLSLKSKEIEQPYKIKYKGDTYFYDGYDYFSTKGYLFEKYNAITILNDEVEVLEEETKEEKKIPEKIKSNGKEFYCDNIDSWIDKEKTSAYCEYLMNKYNDLIDYLNSKGDE